MLAPAANGFEDRELLAKIPSLRRFAMSLVRNNAADADDLLQDAVLRALEHRSQFAPGTNLGAWLFTIMRNSIRSGSRRAKRLVEDPDDALANNLPAPDDPFPALMLADLRAAVRVLSAEQQQIIAFAADGLTYGQIAAEQGVAEGTVKSRLNRARAMLEEHRP